MISKKMKQFTSNSSVIRAMFEEGKRLSKIYGKENVYDYSIGNPSAEPPKEVKKALINVINNQNPIIVHGYSNNAGYEDIRESVAASLNKEFSMDYTYKGIVLTNGAAGAINIALKTILDPDDEVIVFAPFFGEYNSYIKNYDGVIVVVPPDTSSFQINIEEFEKAITKKTKAVIINSPNNPSGVIYSESTIKVISEILEKKQKDFKNSIYLISDEPYRYIVYDNNKVPFTAKYYRNTFTAYSFSKSLSLPGERIGYLAVNSNADDFEDIMAALSVANRISGFVNAPSLFQRIIPNCLDARVDINIYDKNRKLLYNKLKEFGFECAEPMGTFYLFPKSLIEDDDLFCSTAKEYNLLMVPGSAFGCNGYFRLSYCVPYEMILNSFDSFKKLAERYAK